MFSNYDYNIFFIDFFITIPMPFFFDLKKRFGANYVNNVVSLVK